MNSVFRQNFTISDIHLDCFRRVKPSVLLYMAQEVAGQHCLELETDWETLHKKHLFWAVTRHRVQITRLPTAGETLTVETWPMPTTRVAFPRSTVAYDQDGNEVFRSISLWVLMDTESRSMVLPGKSGITVNGTLRGAELAVPGSIVPRAQAHHTQRRVCYTDLDRNLHVNNTRYLDWVDDLLPSAFHREHPVRELTVCYLSEALEGQQIDLSWELKEDGCLQVDAHRQQTDEAQAHTRVFSAMVQY